MLLSLPKEQFYLFRKIVYSTVRVTNPRSGNCGTGVLISADGLILTASHVLRSDETPEISPCRLRKDWSIAFLKSHKAEVIFRDRKLDIAVLRCRAAAVRSKPAKIRFGDVKIGTGVYRVGMDDVPLATGHVHAFNFDGPFRRLVISIIFDCGASGGPIFDERLKLIGIVQSGLRARRPPPEAFVIPVDAVRGHVFCHETVWPLLPEHLRL